MNRSQINTLLADAEDFFEFQGVALPPFAFWDPERFNAQVNDLHCAQIVKRRLGWTVTDFGLGKFTEDGLVAFTMRLSRPPGKDEDMHLVEKYLILRSGQSLPLHCHRNTTKDIVNRSGNTLLAKLYQASDTGDLDKTQRLAVYVDGQERELAPGEIIALAVGESLTIVSGVYYELTASGADAIVCELELTQGGDEDIYFYMPIVVQAEIFEDEPPRRLLVQDYRSRFPGLM